MRIPALASFALFAGVALTLLVATAAVGCSNQGEGEFCDINAGVIGGDCADGLQCGPAPGLQAMAGANVDRCCPGAPGVATVAACMQSASAIDASTEGPDGSIDATSEAAPVEAGEASVEASTPEAGSNDATTDGPSTDAALEGGGANGDASGSAVDASDAAQE
jgi:hypothetical protein